MPRPGTSNSNRPSSSASTMRRSGSATPSNRGGRGNNNSGGGDELSGASLAAATGASATTAAAAAMLDQMDRLIGDADAKFADRQKTLIEAAANATSGSALHVDRGGASLRQQLAHNHHLLADPRFKEMVNECEKCLAPEFSLRGNVLDRALQAMLASLLKALLKEAAALSNPAARKIQIEMTFQWWNDKRREILDQVLSRMPKLERAEKQVEKTEIVDEKKDLVPHDQRAVLAALTGGDPRDTENPPLSVQPCPGLNFRSEAQTEKDRSAVAQKLRLYMKHDLSAGQSLRQQQQQQQGGGQVQGGGLNVQGVGLGGSIFQTPQRGGGGLNSSLSNTSPTTGGGFQPRVVSRKQAGYASATSSSSSSGLSPSNKLRGGAHNNNPTTALQASAAYFGAAHENAPAGPQPFTHISTQAAPRGHTDQNATPNTVEESLAKAHQRMVRHAAKKMEAQFAERESVDMNAALSHNRARLLEETARKLESREYSSQTSRTTHTILSKLRQSDGQLVDSSSKLPSARFEKERLEEGHGGDENKDEFASSASSPASPPLSPEKGSPFSSSPTTTSSPAASGKNRKHRHNQHNRRAEGVPPLSPTGDASRAALAALKKSSYDGQDVSFSPYDNYQLRPQDEQKLKSIMEKIEHANDGTNELPPVSPKLAQFDDQIQVAYAKRHDLRVILPKGVAGSKPAAAQRRLASAPTVKRATPTSPLKSPSSPLSPSARDKATLHNLMKDLYPEVFDKGSGGADELPPSMRKLEELKLVDKVRDAFSRRNPEAMPSYDRLVRALVTPDDAPHEVCVRHLPRPGSGFPKRYQPS